MHVRVYRTDGRQPEDELVGEFELDGMSAWAVAGSGFIVISTETVMRGAVI